MSDFIFPQKLLFLTKLRSKAWLICKSKLTQRSLLFTSVLNCVICIETLSFSIVNFGFYRTMLCIRGTSHGHVPVSVSVTSRCSIKTAKRRITQTTPHDSAGTLVFWRKDLREIRPGSALRGLQMQVGWVKIGEVSADNRLYLENGTR